MIEIKDLNQLKLLVFAGNAKLLIDNHRFEIINNSNFKPMVYTTIKSYKVYFGSVSLEFLDFKKSTMLVVTEIEKELKIKQLLEYLKTGIDTGLKIFVKKNICARCGEQLTDDKSRLQFLGPTCIKTVRKNTRNTFNKLERSLITQFEVFQASVKIGKTEFENTVRWNKSTNVLYLENTKLKNVESVKKIFLASVKNREFKMFVRDGENFICENFLLKIIN